MYKRQSLSGSGIPYFLTLRVYDEVTSSGSVGVPLGETSVGSGSSTTTNTNGEAWFSLGHLTPGETYYIRISHNQSDVEEVLYDLCLFDAATQNPCSQSVIPVADGVECSDDCSKYYRVKLTQDAPSAYYRFEAIGNNGVDVNMNMYYQPNETLGTNTGDITDVDQPCGVQSILPKEDQGILADPGTCNGGSGQYAIFNLIGGSASMANMYYLHVYDNLTLLGCGGLDLCQVNILGPYSSLALAQAGGTPDDDCFSSLPVDLLSFDAVKQPRRNKIFWKVAQEVDIQEYVLQRSMDGQVFSDIEIIEAKGNGLSTYQYSTYDNEMTSAVYYRLMIREMDGHTPVSYTHLTLPTTPYV